MEEITKQEGSLRSKSSTRTNLSNRESHLLDDEVWHLREAFRYRKIEPLMFLPKFEVSEAMENRIRLPRNFADERAAQYPGAFERNLRTVERTPLKRR